MKPATITDRLLFVTLRLAVQKASGAMATGTGFLFTASSGEREIVPLLVTNKHVVEDGLELTTQVHLQDDSGHPILAQSETLRVSAPGARFIPHPNPDVDLCALPIGPFMHAVRNQGKNLFTPFLDKTLILPQEKLEELTAAEDVLMAGYPIGLWDQINNLPLLRRGMTASHPAVAFNGKPVGVIDAACFPGSSGSPVLIVNQGIYVASGGIAVGNRVILLGVLFGGPQQETDGRIEVRPIPTAMSPVPVLRQMIHLGYYVRAEAVCELADIIVKMLPPTPADSSTPPSSRPATPPA